MSSDSHISGAKEIEAALRALGPSALDSAFLDRLDAAAGGSLATLTPGELRFEEELRACSPAPLPPALLANLESIVEGAPFPATEKIVLFPKGAPPARRTSRPGRRSLLSAAAAVAILGATAALLIPGQNRTPAETSSTPPSIRNPQSAIPPASSNHFVPAGFNRGLSATRDEGIVWQSADRPHRVVRVEYTDRLTLKNAEGKTVQVEQPRVEYILVPEKAD